jgi:IMP dehydrogenase/GMP reductase
MNRGRFILPRAKSYYLLTKKGHMAKVLDQVGLTYDDVILRPQYSDIRSRNDVDTSVKLVEGITLRVPLVASSMHTVISVELAAKLWELGGIAQIHQFQSIDKEVEMLTAIKAKKAKVIGVVGATKDYYERAKALADAGVDALSIDTPHAHSIYAIEATKKLKQAFPRLPLIVGTVATKEGVHDLIQAGADSIKFGVGAGAACTTRISAGVGVPQFSAILDGVQGLSKHVTLIADAGIKLPADFSKAIGAGAHAIMAGKMFVGTDEAPSELIIRNGQRFKLYMGEASSAAKLDRVKSDPTYQGGADEYVEGAAGLVPYVGSLESVVKSYAMGLRSAMSYSGARTVAEFHDKAVFMQVSTSSQVESTAHGLVKPN